METSLPTPICQGLFNLPEGNPINLFNQSIGYIIWVPHQLVGKLGMGVQLADFVIFMSFWFMIPSPSPLWNTPHGTMVWCGNPPFSHGFWGKKPGCPWIQMEILWFGQWWCCCFFSGRWLAYVVSFAATMASWAWGGGVGWQNDEGIIWGSGGTLRWMVYNGKSY